MSELYLKFFQEVENGNLWNEYIVLISHSSSISREEALLKAQQKLVGSNFVITNVEFPYIWCHKFDESIGEE